MNEDVARLRDCPLFAGIAPDELAALLACLEARVQTFERGQAILSEGEPARDLWILLSGAAQIVRVDYDGNRSIVAQVTPPQLFGEAFACAEVEALPVSVVAVEPSRALCLRAQRITAPCSSACAFHGRLMRNLLRVVAQKNLLMHRKAEITAKRTTRDKLLTYLQLEAKSCGCNSFSIPFDRQALADYLEVDRSGLSAEIGKLRRAGVLEANRSCFTLLK